MAIMRTGRRGEDPTKKKGVEPTKAQGEVKVTAKKPAEPKKYTWEDVSKNEDIKARNEAKKKQYESDVASYNKAMSLYSGGGTPTASESELSVLKGSKVGGKSASFSGNKDIMSAARENEMYEKGLKSGEYVDIDDPRIDAKTRYFLKGATKGLTSGGDILGEKTGKISVPYEKALGKSKPTKWADVYGGKDFDPYEFEKASKSGNLDKYMSKKGMKPGDLAVSDVGARTQYKTPQKTKEPEYEKATEMSQSEINRIPLPKMRQLKTNETFKGINTQKNVGEVVKKTGKLAISQKAEQAAPEWSEPEGGVRTKTRVVKAKNQSLGDYIGGNIKYAASKLTGGTPVLRGGVNKTREALFQGKAGREAKEFKAYYGAPSSISGSERVGMTAADIAKERESLKGVKKELKADIRKGTSVPKSELRAELKNVRKDIKSAKQAEKYASKNIEARGKYVDGKPETVVIEKPNNQNNPYRGSELGQKYNEFTKFKSSTENPANRNSTFGRKIKN